ncbi:hypothetical protein GQR58_022445 [Nymphon striatum]|nr:hypothetical protein GQR58_022445 [Nymphon striatum]
MTKIAHMLWNRQILDPLGNCGGLGSVGGHEEGQEWASEDGQDSWNDGQKDQKEEDSDDQHEDAFEVLVIEEDPGFTGGLCQERFSVVYESVNHHLGVGFLFFGISAC